MRVLTFLWKWGIASSLIWLYSAGLMRVWMAWAQAGDSSIPNARREAPWTRAGACGLVGHRQESHLRITLLPHSQVHNDTANMPDNAAGQVVIAG